MMIDPLAAFPICLGAVGLPLERPAEEVWYKEFSRIWMHLSI